MSDSEDVRKDALLGFKPEPMSPISSSTSPYSSFPNRAPSSRPILPLQVPVRQVPLTTDAKLFTPEELNVLPMAALNRQKLKQQAKKAKKRRVTAEKTEGELMLGFMGMGVEEPEPEPVESAPRLSIRKMKKAKKQAEKPVVAMEVDDESRKVADFANLLSTMGGELLLSEGRCG